MHPFSGDLRHGDDSAGGTDAGLKFYPTGESFTIAVLGYDNDAVGAYTLAIEPDGPRLIGEGLIVEALDVYAADYAPVGVEARRVDETRMSLRQRRITGLDHSVLGVCDENCRGFDLIIRGPRRRNHAR
ncbi:hypothetical protein OIU13_15065 [Brevundimonas sp. BT-123]|uniref:hypothetical protein n=1 Tax=Brevundimonas sp. BT-123 TaxID=2986928 RepID=UPI0022366D7A|nr:hypothetical protein [Brevundimonas sp. BT-123]MCW0047842.1 hypothetical protein [Brevundimonas sp. BT-123]